MDFWQKLGNLHSLVPTPPQVLKRGRKGRKNALIVIACKPREQSTVCLYFMRLYF